jgi:hypothetical protein
MVEGHRRRCPCVQWHPSSDDDHGPGPAATDAALWFRTTKYRRRPARSSQNLATSVVHGTRLSTHSIGLANLRAAGKTCRMRVISVYRKLQQKPKKGGHLKLDVRESRIATSSREFGGGTRMRTNQTKNTQTKNRHRDRGKPMAYNTY